ncbi:uncharacterized protein LOC117175173 [Belonocnema kinseyi]|uniref:uncharacterized protein LOC117175173 n=1 Tax=Belonocnema kinseyi TaxID=2817044 RepID=UPI00143D1B50|nr:uncharacterized protein LOC117175173 [Belonocnema kinseyi]XP_033220670.1 uncharacterized protein LOC117175173 [Belonocnema kinseyi]
MGGHRCIAPNCKSGYDSTRSSGEKKVFFCVPKNAVESWQQAIKRTKKDLIVKPGHLVCQDHFLKDQIIWKKEVLAPDGSVMASEWYKKPKLKPGVLPSQFSKCPEPCSKAAKKPRRLLKRDFVTKNSEMSNKKTSGKLKHSDIVKIFENDANEKSAANVTEDFKKEKIFIIDGISDIFPVHLNSNKCLFDYLFKYEKSVSFPLGWIRNIVQTGELRVVVFTQMIVRRENGSTNTICVKKVVVDDEMNITVFLSDREIKKSEIGLTDNPISSINEIEGILSVMHALKICPDFY